MGLGPAALLPLHALSYRRGRRVTVPQTECVTVALPVGTLVDVVGHTFADGPGVITAVPVERVSYGQPSPVPRPTASKRATAGVPACLAICVQCHVCAVCAAGHCATTFTQVQREGRHPGWGSSGREPRREEPSAAARAAGYLAACPVGGLHRRPVADGWCSKPLVARAARCGHGWQFVRTATAAVIRDGRAVAGAADPGASALRLLTALPALPCLPSPPLPARLQPRRLACVTARPPAVGEVSV